MSHAAAIGKRQPGTAQGLQAVLPLPDWLQWLSYFGFFVGIGVFLALAELQHYLRMGGLHPWEPFLWEISSTLTTAVLTLGIYRWHRFLLQPPRSILRLAGGHLLGAFAYILAHSAGMYGLRAVVYGLSGISYDPGGVMAVLAYEGSKDIVFYLLLVALCHGALLIARDRHRQAELATLEAELQQAQLDRLQEQVQPHFLFNTLNLVSSVMREDIGRADRILAELADLLRESLAANRAQLHTLTDEMRIIAPFLSIMQQRFESRLEVAIELEPAAAACLVPSLLLIAPVENAVKHGVAQARGPVRVEVSARVAAGRLEIRVADSAGQLRTDQRDGGIGLANLRQRLAALYGAAADVRLELREGHTLLELFLPARTAR